MALLPYHLDTTVLGVLALLVIHNLYQRRKNPSRLPYPPGPPPLPIIGNLLDIPVAVREPWKTYATLSQRYGDIVRLSALGQNIVILGSLQPCIDLLEKRSNIYSSRPHSTMLADLMGMKWSLAIMPYGEEWRKVRRGFHQYFNSNVASSYIPVHEAQSRDFLWRLVQTPDDFLAHIRHAFAASIMKVTYGIEVKDSSNEYVHIAEEVITGFNEAAQPGHFLVDNIEWLKYIPAWIPGAGFQRKAEYYKHYGLQMLNKPFDAVQKALAIGSAVPSIATEMIEQMNASDNREEKEHLARRATSIAYVGGADTTVSAVTSFFLAMVMYPEVQRKAQAELDAVVGPNRLPTFEDRPSLPYIEAIMKESLRWQLVTPMSVPHCTIEDDEYNGYFIPKGSVVMAAAWSILHDPVEFPDPEAFQPERFLKDGKLNPDVRDPTVACFGFGRRVCAGRYFALNQLYSTVACVLHSFSITPALDEDGNPIPVEPQMSNGIVSYPAPFKCMIKPRSASAEALIINESHHQN